MSRIRRIAAVAILTALASSACSGTDDAAGVGGTDSGTVSSTSVVVESTSDQAVSTSSEAVSTSDVVESTGAAPSAESSAGGPSPSPVSSFPDSSASGPVSQSRPPVADAVIDDAAAQRISDDLNEALGLMRRGEYDGFNFVHVATVLEQIGIPAHSASTDKAALRAYERAANEIGHAGLQMMWIYPDAPFNGTDIVWQLEFGNGSPDPVAYRLRDDVDFDAVIEFFVDHDFDSTERADGTLELTTSGGPIDDIFSAVAFPDQHLLVQSHSGFTLPDDDGAAGTELAYLAADAGPGVLVSVTTGEYACTNPYTSAPMAEPDPDARASMIESIEEEVAKFPLGPIIGVAIAVRDGQVVAVARYPDAAAAEKDLPGRRTLLDGRMPGGPLYSDWATMVVEQDGDLLRYTADPVDGIPISDLTTYVDVAPWRICR